ncbi:hypothetical protein FHR56_000566 [Xanthomonas sacchari]|uniref:hypothetical protein n=1 Tax=unclassified Xanthomonas TaxID=2643310 RepID=UPI00160A10E7|nr:MULTISPECIES: hypothetical protein [unclassified Xanthomonas]MBB6365453.1 hypothetical protein [Xanthomonas sp. F10]MXV32225.1 hypothetical protein [Xanthomonas sp. LMG 8989]
MALARPILTSLALAATLAACKAQPTGSTVAAATAAPSQAAPAAAAPRCPDADFDAFLKRFSADSAVQEKATADPLTMIHIDPDAQPEPAPVTRNVPLSEVEWPVIPNLDAARKGGREIVVTQNAEGRQVMVRTPDTGDQQIYQFAQRPCWTLVKVDDQAL